MRQLIHSRDLSFSWLPQSVKSVTVQQLVPSLAPYVACPSQQIIICCWSVLLKHAKSDFCKLFFLKLCIWEKTIGTGPNKNNNLLIQGRYLLATPKTPSRERLPSKSREPQGMVLGQPGGAAIDFQPTPPINQEPLGCVFIFPFCWSKNSQPLVERKLRIYDLICQTKKLETPPISWPNKEVTCQGNPFGMVWVWSCCINRNLVASTGGTRWLVESLGFICLSMLVVSLIKGFTNNSKHPQSCT